MKSFLAGLGLGALLGLMFAPQAGEETRNLMRDRIGDLADRANETIMDLRGDNAETEAA